MLFHFVLVEHRPDRQIFAVPRGGARWRITAALMRAKSFSVAAKSAIRVRVRSAVTSGLRDKRRHLWHVRFGRDLLHCRLEIGAMALHHFE